jgi:pantothenate kinase
MPQQLAATTDRIQTLLARLDRGDYPDRARIETTLTDGYACALRLDAECDRIERRLADRAAKLGDNGTAAQARELSSLARLLAKRRRELESLRDLLSLLRAGFQQAKVA